MCVSLFVKVGVDCGLGGLNLPFLCGPQIFNR